MTNSGAKLLVKTKSQRFGYYELLIFAFLLFEFIFLAYGKLVDPIAKTISLITYKFGFLSKALIGSIFSLFTDRITSHEIYVTAIISYLILSALISLMLGMIIRNSRQEMISAVIIFVMLFLSSPLSITYLLGMYIGRFDTYWIIITLIALIFLKNPVLRYLVPLFCITAILVNQGFMFTYMPALAIPLFYEIYRNKYSKKSIAIFSLSCLSMIILFIFFQFSTTNIPFKNAVDFAAYLSNFSDFQVSTVMLHITYFAPFKESYYEYVRPLIASYALPLGIELLTFSLPLLIIFWVVWKKCFCKTENKFLKFVFILCAFSPLIFIPVAFSLNDWDRYWSAIINTQFILIFYFIFSDESAVIDSVKKIGDFFSRHYLLLILIIVFACSLKFSKTVTDMFSFVKDKNAISEILEKYTNDRVDVY